MSAYSSIKIHPNQNAIEKRKFIQEKNWKKSIFFLKNEENHISPRDLFQFK